MIVSHAYKFLFLRPRFVGSSSVEFALSRLCRCRDDIITPITFPEERERRKLGVRPRNYATRRIYEKAHDLGVTIGSYSLSRYFLRKGSTLRFINHIPYDKARPLLPPVVQSYHKISIERHPYEKALSAAAWSLTKGEYIKEGLTKNVTNEMLLQRLEEMIANGRIGGVRNWQIYASNNRVVADTIVQNDELEAGINRCLASLGVEEKIELSWKKGARRPKVASAHEILPQRIKEIIYDLCRQEFDHFGYAR